MAVKAVPAVLALPAVDLHALATSYNCNHVSTAQTAKNNKSALWCHTEKAVSKRSGAAKRRVGGKETTFKLNRGWERPEEEHMTVVSEAAVLFKQEVIQPHQDASHPLCFHNSFFQNL